MLEIEGLCAGYGGVPALNGVSIRVESGELAELRSTSAWSASNARAKPSVG